MCACSSMWRAAVRVSVEWLPEARGDEAITEALLAQLDAHGLASNQAGPTMIGPPQASWYLTGFGHEVLKYLVDFPSHPNHEPPPALTT
jgi:hypothetical protein